MTGNEFSELGQETATFKYKNLRSYFIWLACGIFPLSVFFAVGAIRQGSVSGIVFSICFLLFFLLFVGYLFMVGAADVIISDDGICRRVGSRALQAMRWSEVGVIKVFDTYDRQTQRMKIGMNIYPVVRPRHPLTVGGKMVLGDDPMRQGNFSELIGLLNNYISQYHIKIESTLGGEKSFPDRLELLSPKNSSK